MRALHSLACLASLTSLTAVLSLAHEASAGKPPTWPHKVFLDGVETPASWDDGDTFAVPGEDGRPRRLRLAGYNTLESYGPVHRWGEWTPRELHALAMEAGRVAGERAWACTVLGGEGGYGRGEVDCPELKRELLGRGLAHVFAVGQDGDPADLALQAEAMAARKGMWAKGAPVLLVTSVHSLDEKPGQTSVYNRVAVLATGRAEERAHAETWAACQEVCVGGTPPAPEASCMVYVPYAQRYKNKAACIAAP